MDGLSIKPDMEENNDDDLLQVCRLSYSNPCFVLGSFVDEPPDVMDVQYIHQTLCMDWEKQMIRRATPKASKKYMKEIMTTTATGFYPDLCIPNTNFMIHGGYGRILQHNTTIIKKQYNSKQATITFCLTASMAAKISPSEFVLQPAAEKLEKAEHQRENTLCLTRHVLLQSYFETQCGKAPVCTLVDKPLKEYITGSFYKGSYDRLGFSGIGTYYFPHGAIYEGQFSNGEFHGSGTLMYPNGQQIEGTWRKGKLKKWIYKYSDGLQHSKPWDYLALPDRAYQIELKKGFKAPGAEYVTSKKIEIKCPPGCYDVGNEDFYDHNKRVIYSKDGKMRRIVNEEEISMIRKNFRLENDKPVGYHPEYYEYWSTGRKSEIRKIDHMYIDKRKFNTPKSYFSTLE